MSFAAGVSFHFLARQTGVVGVRCGRGGCCLLSCCSELIAHRFAGAALLVWLVGGVVNHYAGIVAGLVFRGFAGQQAFFRQRDGTGEVLPLE